MIRPKLVFTRLGCSAQLWKPLWRGSNPMPYSVLTLWWPTRAHKRPRLRLYFWRGRNRHPLRGI